MDCEQARERFGAAADDPQLAEHLAGCADCAGDAAVVRLARELPFEELPEGFESRLRNRLACAPSRPGRTRTWVAAGLAGALVAAGLGTVMLSRPRVPSARTVTFAAGAPSIGAARAALPRAAVAHGPVAAAPSAASRAVAGPARAAVAPAPSGLSGQDLIGGRRVIQQARVTVRVSDVRGVFDSVQSWVSQQGGYVGSSSFSSGRRGDQATLQLRLPAGRIAPLLTRLHGMGRVSSVSQSGRDVTGQYIDLGARLNALQAEDQAYLRLLSRAKTISDTLQLEQQLTRVEAQIESITAQRRQLQRLTTLATVDLQILPAQRPAGALQSSWRTFLAALRAVGLAAVWALPWVLLAGAVAGVALAARRLWRR